MLLMELMEGRRFEGAEVGSGFEGSSVNLPHTNAFGQRRDRGDWVHSNGVRAMLRSMDLDFPVHHLESYQAHPSG